MDRLTSAIEGILSDVPNYTPEVEAARKNYTIVSKSCADGFQAVPAEDFSLQMLNAGLNVAEQPAWTKTVKQDKDGSYKVEICVPEDIATKMPTKMSGRSSQRLMDELVELLATKGGGDVDITLKCSNAKQAECGIAGYQHCAWEDTQQACYSKPWMEMAEALAKQKSGRV